MKGDHSVPTEDKHLTAAGGRGGNARVEGRNSTARGGGGGEGVVGPGGPGGDAEVQGDKVWHSAVQVAEVA